MDLLKSPFSILRAAINSGFADKEPWQIVSVTTSTVLLTIWMWEVLNHSESRSFHFKTKTNKLIFFVTF